MRTSWAADEQVLCVCCVSVNISVPHSTVTQLRASVEQLVSCVSVCVCLDETKRLPVYLAW